MTTRKTIRCAIYTRKSSDEGLDQSFNSLDAQREAGEAYVKSQAHEGWKVIPELYDDGGYSGGTMERPALQSLLRDVDAGLVDVVVVYKIDRLTRSLPDFARIVERFDAREVSFVSVTQAFNTTSSMGRLTLNVLLSFAQFEREVTGERIRDKIAASKAKGMWMGGNVPLGYDLPAAGTRTLQVNETEAVSVRQIFSRYLELGSVHALQRELADKRIVSKRRTTASGRTIGGQPHSRGALFHMLRNPVYLGRIAHKSQIYPGNHQAIVDEGLFDAVQAKLDGTARRHQLAAEGRTVRSPLVGKIVDDAGDLMSPTFSQGRGGRIYRYYVSTSVQQGAKPDRGSLVQRISGPTIEALLTDCITRWLPRADSPLELLISVRLRQVGLLIDMPAQYARDIASNIIAPERIVHTDAKAIRIEVPMTLPLRGGRPIVITGAPRTARHDPILIGALRKAHAMLERERGMPIMGTAPTSPYDRKVLRLALIDPALQRDILAGHQPPSLNLERFLQVEVPLAWKGQRQALGWH